MERIKVILRKTSMTDEAKLIAINLIVNEDNSKSYGENKLVHLTDEELKKLNSKYGDQVIKHMIERLDSYVYGSGKQYKSHYSTILNWIRKDGTIKEIPKVYKCSYGAIHRVWEDCTCGNF